MSTVFLHVAILIDTLAQDEGTRVRGEDWLGTLLFHAVLVLLLAQHQGVL